MTPLIEAIQAVIAAAKIAQRDRALAPIERRLKAQMAAALKAHEKAFMAEFSRFGPGLLGEASAATVTPIEGALEAAYRATLADFSVPIEAARTAAMSAAARHRSAEFGVSFAFDAKNPSATALIKDQAAKSAGEIDATTREDITAILTRGMEQGYDYKTVAAEIAAKYQEYTAPVSKPRHVRNRAELIAINEAGEAYEAGNRLVVDELVDGGLEMEKSWSNVGDGRVSDGCLRNSAAGWIPVDQAFPSGHQHPTRFPGCRCACLYRRKPTAAAPMAAAGGV